MSLVGPNRGLKSAIRKAIFDNVLRGQVAPVISFYQDGMSAAFGHSQAVDESLFDQYGNQYLICDESRCDGEDICAP